MSDEKKKPKLPPEIRNKLMRSKRPHIALFEGPGPFQLPSLTAVEGTVKAPLGHVGIGLETKSAQAVHIVLTEQAASALYDLLGTYFLIQRQNERYRHRRRQDRGGAKHSCRTGPQLAGPEGRSRKGKRLETSE